MQWTKPSALGSHIFYPSRLIYSPPFILFPHLLPSPAHTSSFPFPCLCFSCSLAWNVLSTWSTLTWISVKFPLSLKAFLNASSHSHLSCLPLNSWGTYSVTTHLLFMWFWPCFCAHMWLCVDMHVYFLPLECKLPEAEMRFSLSPSGSCSVLCTWNSMSTNRSREVSCSKQLYGALPDRIGFISNFSDAHFSLSLCLAPVSWGIYVDLSV